MYDMKKGNPKKIVNQSVDKVYEKKRLYVYENKKLLNQREVARRHNLSDDLVNKIILGIRTDHYGIIEYCYKLLK
jgi:tyrosine-protein phosphatase YwqE